MSIFSAIKHAIFGDHGPLGGQFSGKQGTAAPTPAQPAQQPRVAPAAAAPAPAPAAGAPAAAAPAPGQPEQPVDVEQVLSSRPGADSLDWRHSIVDLLKLLSLDSSLSARKELASELDVHAGADGSAEENIALHKAVMRALAQNGGKVPASLTD